MPYCFPRGFLGIFQIGCNNPLSGFDISGQSHGRVHISAVLGTNLEILVDLGLAEGAVVDRDQVELP